MPASTYKNLLQRLKRQVCSTSSSSSSTNRNNNNGTNTQQPLKDRIESLWNAATNVEVCFLVDITGSMASIITAVKEQVRALPALHVIQSMGILHH